MSFGRSYYMGCRAQGRQSHRGDHVMWWTKLLHFWTYWLETWRIDSPWHSESDDISLR